MQYEINYAGMLPEAKHQKAIADIKEYFTSLGHDENFYNELITEYREYYNDKTFEAFRMHISMAGIAGYPAKALWNELFPYS